MHIKAIPTRYRGFFFRSRAEARFAVFCDSIGIKWEYEVQGFELPSGKYLPDFLLPEKDVWIEIKGQRPTAVEVRKFVELCQFTDRFGFLFYNQIGEPRFRIVKENGMVKLVKLSSGWLGVQALKRAADSLAGFVGWDDEAIGPEWTINQHANAFAEIGGEIEIVPLHVMKLSGDVSKAIQQGIGAVNPSDQIESVVKFSHDATFELSLFCGSLRDFHSPRLLAAYTAARSARFEHGENSA